VREIKVSWITQESQRGTLPLPARNLPISHVPAAAAPPHALIFFLTRSGWFLTSSTTTPSSKASARGGSRWKHLNRGGSTARATAAGAALEAWAMSPCRPSPPTSDDRSRCRCRQGDASSNPFSPSAPGLSRSHVCAVLLVYCGYDLVHSLVSLSTGQIRAVAANPDSWDFAVLGCRWLLMLFSSRCVCF
jgi:hypothetical protein